MNNLRPCFISERIIYYKEYRKIQCYRLGPRQLSMMDFYAEMVRNFWPCTTSQKNIIIASDV